MDGRWTNETEVVALVESAGFATTGASLVAAGFWSDCYQFSSGGVSYAARVGQSPDDFAKDARFARLSAASLPIPVVHAFGEAESLPRPGIWFAISDWMPGTPLEAADHWPAVIPSVVATLTSLRDAAIAEPGWGIVGADGRGRFGSWRDFLVAVGDESTYPSIPGWRAAVAADKALDRFFRERHDQLSRLRLPDVSRSIAHCDLLNRNVHVLDDRISGLFDWGNAIYGDHLYNLAAFRFWHPWFPHIDVDALDDAILGPMLAAGEADDVANRLAACYLHIGLEHAGYTSFIGEWDTVAQISDRIRTLVPLFA